MGEYDFSSNEIEGQATFLKNHTKYHTIILPCTKNKFSLNNLITNE